MESFRFDVVVSSVRVNAGGLISASTRICPLVVGTGVRLSVYLWLGFGLDFILENLPQRLHLQILRYSGFYFLLSFPLPFRRGAIFLGRFRFAPVIAEFGADKEGQRTGRKQDQHHPNKPSRR